jgi:hypothetical protein
MESSFPNNWFRLIDFGLITCTHTAWSDVLRAVLMCLLRIWFMHWVISYIVVVFPVEGLPTNMIP